MARTSPSAERTVNILNLLAHEAGGALRLSEMVRRLNITKATAHAVLETLTVAGFVHRDNARRYSLGPAAIALGEAFRRRDPRLVAAGPHLQQLAEETGGYGLLSILSGGYIVVVDGRRSSISERSFDWRTSTRVPFVPPFGTIYVAWDQSRVEQWLSRSPHVVTAAERAHFEEAWSVVRASGYAVLGWADARARVAELLAGLDVAPLSDEVTLIEKFARQALSYEEYLLTDLRPSQSYTVNGISAPLFDNDGSVDMTITVEFASRSLVGTQIEHYGERIRMAAASIGDEVRGLPGSSTKA